MVVTVISLMEAGEVAEVSGHLTQHDGTFPIACDGSSVVVQDGGCELMEVIEGGHHICLGEHSCLFEVRVCQVA